MNEMKSPRLTLITMTDSKRRQRNLRSFVSITSSRPRHLCELSVETEESTTLCRHKFLFFYIHFATSMIKQAEVSRKNAFKSVVKRKSLF